WSASEWFVVEADESDGTFLELPTEVAIVTSVEADHLDHYGSAGAIEEAFAEFLTNARSLRVVCADDHIAARLAAGVDAVTYGLSPTADYRIDRFHVAPARTRLSVTRRGEPLPDVVLAPPGAHPPADAAPALAV